MGCITKAKPPKMQGSYCFSVKLLVFSTGPWGKRVTSFISVSVVNSQTAALSFFSLLDLNLKRKMKEVVKPQKDVGKGERGQI